MRVAVHFDDDHPLAQADGPAVVAFRVGRIEDGVHNAPVGHDPVELGEFLQRVLTLAHAEYPECEITQDESIPNRISLERLVQKAEDPAAGEWISADKFDPDVHVPVGAGVTLVREKSATAAAVAPAQEADG